MTGVADAIQAAADRLLLEHNIELAGVRMTQATFDALVTELGMAEAKGQKYAVFRNIHVVVFEES